MLKFMAAGCFLHVTYIIDDRQSVRKWRVLCGSGRTTFLVLVSAVLVFTTRLFFFFSLVATGWQQRWFVLKSGVLYYYVSESEVGQACKGSLKVASCDIMGKSRQELTIVSASHLKSNLSYKNTSLHFSSSEWSAATGHRYSAGETPLS